MAVERRIITLKTQMGWVEFQVPAIIDGHLAVSRGYKTGKVSYMVTHLPTGYYLANLIQYQKQALAAMQEMIDTGVDWSAATVAELKFTPEQRKLIMGIREKYKRRDY